MQLRKLRKGLLKIRLMQKPKPQQRQQERRHLRLKRKREKKNMHKLLKLLKLPPKQLLRLKPLIKEENFWKKLRKPKKKPLRPKLLQLLLLSRKHMTD